MSATRLLMAQLVVLIALVGIVFYGFDHDALWDTFWYSSLAHFLGGLWCALFAAWTMRFLEIPFHIQYCVLSAVLLGVGWEIFEVIIGATHYPASTLYTIADISMDIFGGLFGAYLVR